MQSEFFPGIGVAARLEQALAAHAAAYGTTIALLQPSSQSTAMAVAGGWAIRTGADLPINRAVALGMREPIDSSALNRVEALYHAAGLPAEIELCPLADASLHDLVRARGYHFDRFMNVSLRGLDGGLPSSPEDIDITVVSPERAGVWIHMVAGAIPQPDDTPSMLLARSALLRPNVTGFLATIDGEPAGGAAMALGGGVAVLFSSSTSPKFRRRGVQSALICARLAAAAAAGCDLAVVQTSPGNGSQRNLHRHGFRVAYTNALLTRPA